MDVRIGKGKEASEIPWARFEFAVKMRLRDFLKIVEIAQTSYLKYLQDGSGKQHRVQGDRWASMKL